MVHLNHGFLLLKEKNFKPDTDIFFGEYNWAADWADVWCNYGQECFEAENLEKVARYFNLNPSAAITEAELSELNAKQLKYLRNYFYALRGLDFKDEEVKKFYEQFFWYKPDKTLKTENIKLSKAESVFLAKVKNVAQRRK